MPTMYPKILLLASLVGREACPSLVGTGEPPPPPLQAQEDKLGSVFEELVSEGALESAPQETLPSSSLVSLMVRNCKQKSW